MWVNVTGIPLSKGENTIAAHTNPRKQAGLTDVPLFLLYDPSHPGEGLAGRGHPSLAFQLRTGNYSPGIKKSDRY